MVTRIEGSNGDFLELADSLDELPWFMEVLAEAEAYLASVPRESLPAWARLERQ